MEPTPLVLPTGLPSRFVSYSRRAAVLALLSGCAGCSASHPRPPLTAASAESECSGPAARCPPADVSALGFGLVVLGSGGGPRSLGRAGSSYAVVVEGVPRVLIDVGPGTFLRLGELELDLRALDLVLLTHLHVDHSGDLPGVVLARAVTGEGGPMTFRIAGPAGAGQYPSITDFIERLFGSQGAFPFVPQFTQSSLRFDVTELPANATSDARLVIDGDGFSVRALPVDHGGVPALAYRIEHAGHALVISGDLASKDDHLLQLAERADLLVYDTAVLDPPGSTESLYASHTPPQRIGEVAARAHVRSLLLSHLTGRVADHAAQVLGSVQAGFQGDVRFAQDCMIIDLSAK